MSRCVQRYQHKNNQNLCTIKLKPSSLSSACFASVKHCLSVMTPMFLESLPVSSSNRFIISQLEWQADFIQSAQAQSVFSKLFKLSMINILMCSSTVISNCYTQRCFIAYSTKISDVELYPLNYL